LLDIEAAVGFTFNLTSASGEQPRLGAGAVFWPRAGRWGFGISAHAGPGARVSEPRFIGRLLDAGLVAACHVRTTPERALRWSAAAGPGLRFSMLDGDLPSEARSASVTWVAPSFELELRGDWLLSSELFVGLRASSSLLLLTERYVVREQAVVELARVSFGAGLAFGMMLPAQ
jgi:hypothetical protein